MAARKLRVHLENTRAVPDVYQITPQRWSAACRRHRALARRVEASFGWDGDILDDALRDAVIMIGVRSRLEALAERAPRLRWLHATLTGMDRLLPFDWLPRGVVLTNNRGAHGVKAEQFMRMAFTMLHTRMAQIIANQHARHWEQLFSPNIVGRTALIVGLGDLGEAAARAAKQLPARGQVLTSRFSGLSTCFLKYGYVLLLPIVAFSTIVQPKEGRRVCRETAPSRSVSRGRNARSWKAVCASIRCHISKCCAPR